ncbi:MAG TPA: hypothetical protein VFF12_12295, partial [Myxococcaceae bacterium]|nr:hypothetical protein [Myxococcaceae bacterium]
MLRASDMEKVSLARGGWRKHGEVTPSCRGPPRRPGVVLPSRGGRGLRSRPRPMRRPVLVALLVLVGCASTKVES